MSLDTQFVRSLVACGDWSKIREAGLDEKWLFDEGLKSFVFVRDHFKQHGQMPNVQTIEGQLGFSLGEAPEPLAFYLERLKIRYMGNVVAAGLEASAKQLRSDPLTGPHLALEEVKLLARSAGNLDRAGDNALIDLTKTTDFRWNEYQRLKTLGGVIDGIPTPWKRVNEQTRGIHNGELWVIVAKLKTGKSWMEVVLADHIWRLGAGHRPLVISQEMANVTMARRLDARYAELPYGEFRAGMLDAFGEQKYRDALDAMKLQSNPLFVAGSGKFRAVADVEILIEEIHPTIVMIDGVYLMKDPHATKKGGGKYEHVSKVVDELQVLAQRKNVPIVISTQFNRKVGKDKTDAGSEFMGYAYEIAQNCDVMIGLFRSEDDKAAGRMRLRLMETRECNGLDLMVEWDLKRMAFKEIGLLQGDDLVPDGVPGGQVAQAATSPSDQGEIPW